MPKSQEPRKKPSSNLQSLCPKVLHKVEPSLKPDTLDTESTAVSIQSGDGLLVRGVPSRGQCPGVPPHPAATSAGPFPPKSEHYCVLLSFAVSLGPGICKYKMPHFR